MTEDKGKEDSPSDRLEEIKREEKEDASSYYAQGESKDNVNEETELSNPVEDIDPQKEEMNMLKAIAFLGFGMAALAIIFILESGVDKFQCIFFKFLRPWVSKPTLCFKTFCGMDRIPL